MATKARQLNTIPANVNVAKSSERSQELLKRHQANELFIAVVGPAGAGAGTAASILKSYLEQIRIDGSPYSVEVIKASSCIHDWASENSLVLPGPGRKSVDSIRIMQDRGDDMRRLSSDNAAVAREVIRKIRESRASNIGQSAVEGQAVEPDGKPRAYIIDSLRHPAEARLLRDVYKGAFALVGVVCDSDTREKRLRHNLFDKSDWSKLSSKEAIKGFMDRDANAPEKYGQHVVDTFHQADFFVDNSKEVEEELSNTGMNEDLRRLVDLVTSSKIVRPTIGETAMHHAASAQYRSACLSRQVGAAIVDRRGNIIATGTNEVPAAGGGVYGERFASANDHDMRCAFRETVYCSSNREQNDIIRELIKDFPELLGSGDEDTALKKLRKTRIGGLIEFSRAVHAEMDAILSAARSGVSPVGSRLFVTAFPCHYCARHIVTAGIEEVQYIEPYPKSRALTLHDDSITTDVVNWFPSDEESLQKVRDPNSKFRVLFRPFVGVAPRMYERAFLKDRDYKDGVSGELKLAAPDWNGPSDISAVSYSKLEAELAKA